MKISKLQNILGSLIITTHTFAALYVFVMLSKLPGNEAYEKTAIILPILLGYTRIVFNHFKSMAFENRQSRILREKKEPTVSNIFSIISITYPMVYVLFIIILTYGRVSSRSANIIFTEVGMLASLAFIESLFGIFTNEIMKKIFETKSY